MKVLVTGAAGRLGSAVCNVLLAHGHEVRGTDRAYRPDAPLRLEMADLLDEIATYRLVEGCEAVAHCGNHPHFYAVTPAQRLLRENLAMNANVCYAAVDLGVHNLVFISSIQAISHTGHRRWHKKREQNITCRFPYLPIDGDAPPNPSNAYALSKVLGEQMLQHLAQQHPQLSATAIRLPGLPDLNNRPDRRLASKWLSINECFAYLEINDAARLVARALEKAAPGYRQYLPSGRVDFGQHGVANIIQRYYTHIPLRQPVDQIDQLIDTTAVSDQLGWQPQTDPLVMEPVD